MATDHSVPFFRSLVDILQGLSRNLVDHHHCVEITGYICVESDHWKKERYVLSEVLRRSGGTDSKSHCVDIQTSSREVSECCHQHGNSEASKRGFVASANPEEEVRMSPCKQTGNRAESSSNTSNLDHPDRPKCIEDSHSLLNILQAASPDSASCDAAPIEMKSIKSKSAKRTRLPASLLLSCLASSQSRNSLHGSDCDQERSHSIVTSGKNHDASDSLMVAIEPERSKRRRPQTESTGVPELTFETLSPKRACRISEVNRLYGDLIGETEEQLRGHHSDDKMDRNCTISIACNAEEGNVSVNTSPHKSLPTTRSVDVDLHVNDVCFGQSIGNEELCGSPECVSSSKLDGQAGSEQEEKPITVISADSGKTKPVLVVSYEKAPDSSSGTSSGNSNTRKTSLTQTESMVDTVDSNTHSGGASEQSVVHTERYSRGKCVAERFKKFHLDKTGRDVDLFKTLPQELNMLLLEYLSEVKKIDGGELRPRTLKGMFEHLGFYMRENGYACSITTDHYFQTSKDYIKRKLKEKVVIESAASSPIDVNDLEVILQSKHFGPPGLGPLTNSMWFMNTQFLGLIQTSEHATLKWGDICLKTDENQREYLERPVEGTTCNKLYAKPRNHRRCFVSFYKQFRDFRPLNSLEDDAPFYLRYHDSKDGSSFQSEALSSRQLGRLWPKLLLVTGLPMNKKISNPWTEGRPAL